MFDTITGLPVHALVVHAVVVLLPLMSLVTIAVAVRPAWRGYGRLVVVADLLVLVAAFVARQSGLVLAKRISQFGSNDLVSKHQTYGNYVPLFALALVVAAVVVMLSHTRKTLVPVAVVLALVTGLGATGWTVLTGDSGARAVWSGTIKNTTAP